MVDLLDAGVRIVVTLSLDDSPHELAHAINVCTGMATISDLVQPFRPLLTPPQQMLLRWSIRRGTSRISVAQMAEELATSDRTLRRWCEGLGGLSTVDFLSWGRLLHASRMLSETDMSVEAICAALDFSDASDLRRKFQRVTGRRLSAVNREDALTSVIEGVRDRLLKASA